MLSSAIKVGARTYAVACIDDVDFDLLLAQRGIIDGDVKSFIDYDEQLVVVRARLTTDHRRELIVHELIHAALADSGAEQGEASERLVSVLAPRMSEMLAGLNDVLKDTCS